MKRCIIFNYIVERKHQSRHDKYIIVHISVESPNVLPKSIANSMKSKL